MARACVVCGKGSVAGNRVSHSNRKTRRRWMANVQRIRVVHDGSPRRAYVCTKCLKAGKVVRAI